MIYDWQGVDANGLPSFDDQPPGAACLRTLLGDDFFDEVAIVYVPAGAKAEATNAGLKHIEGLPQIETLSLSDTEVTDAGLEHLKRLTRLKELDLNRTQVTDAGLERLKHLSKFKCWTQGNAGHRRWRRQAPEGPAQLQDHPLTCLLPVLDAGRSVGTCDS